MQRPTGLPIASALYKMYNTVGRIKLLAGVAVRHRSRPEVERMAETILLGARFAAPFAFRVDSAEAVIDSLESTARDATALAYVVTANLDHFASLARCGKFVSAYREAAARTLDGAPLVWAGRYKSGRPVSRITGHDLLQAVFTRDRARSARLFLIAATREVGQRFTERLQALGYLAE